MSKILTTRVKFIANLSNIGFIGKEVFSIHNSLTELKISRYTLKKIIVSILGSERPYCKQNIQTSLLVMNSMFNYSHHMFSLKCIQSKILPNTLLTISIINFLTNLLH